MEKKISQPKKEVCKHKFVESKEVYSGSDDGDRRYYLTIFCENCGIIKKELVAENRSTW